jgi:hypothetical protein
MGNDDEHEQIKSRAFETMEERLARRRKKASVGKLIMYIITLIFVIILILWLKNFGRFY